MRKSVGAGWFRALVFNRLKLPQCDLCNTAQQNRIKLEELLHPEQGTRSGLLPQTVGGWCAAWAGSIPHNVSAYLHDYSSPPAQTP